jgi:hypothetical protein
MKTIKFQTIKKRKLALVEDEKYIGCSECYLHQLSPTTGCMVSDKENDKLDCCQHRVYKKVKIKYEIILNPIIKK